MMRRRIAAVFGLLVTGACSGSAIDVGPGTAGARGVEVDGSGNAGGSPVETAGAAPVSCPNNTFPLATYPSRTACAGANDSPLVGSWHGYVENQPAPWDELFLEVNGSNSDGLCGTLRIGSAEPPPPATDPNVTYPPGVVDHPSDYLIPGFALTLMNGSTDGTRVRFGVSPQESYDGWCRIQTVYADSDGSCSCIPPLSGGANRTNDHCTWDGQVIDCGKVQMCAGTPVPVCMCNASGCSATTGTVNFDLRVNGDLAEGSDTGHSNSRVYFTRVH